MTGTTSPLSFPPGLPVAPLAGRFAGPEAGRSARREAAGREREEGRSQRSGPGAALLPTAIGIALLGLVLCSQGLWIFGKAIVAQVLLERAFAATLATGRPVKPWSWADTWPVARIEVPRLKANVIALDGSSGQALAFGPGHMKLTPDAGEPGTAIYAAHRDTHFAFLADVRVGDEVDVTRQDGARFRYRVTQTSVVRFDASAIDAFAPGHNLVLATCWPFGARTPGALRYIVHARLVGEPGAPD